MAHPFRVITLIVALASCIPAGPAAAAESIASAAAPVMLTGQTLYVPCYSQIYHGIKTRPIDLTVTLSVRNTDPKRAITVTVVDYHDTSGKLIRRYLDAPVILGPLMTVEFIVGQTDNSGGSGANFLVRWNAPQPANPPMVETVMIGTSSQQGISFTSKGRPIAGD